MQFFKSVVFAFLINVVFCTSPILGQSKVIETREAFDIEPNDNESVLYKEVSLSWEDFSILDVFQVQLAENKDFEGVILDTLVNGNYFFTNILENHKEYFWRVRDASPECDPYTFEDYHFFKTTNIVIDNENENTAIKIFPTHINGKEVIYFDNPDYLEFDISIVSLTSKSQYRHKCSSDRKGITTESWPRGAYQVTISSPNNFTQTRDIVLY